MERLVFGLFMMIALVSTQQRQMEDLDQIFVFPLDAPQKIQKRETATKVENSGSLKFIEDKLIEQAQAFEQLFQMANKNEESMQQLIEVLSAKTEEPKLPETVEVRDTRRSNNVVEEDTENPVLKFGRRIPMYGNLFKNVIVRYVQNTTDPTPLVAKSY